MAWGSRSRSGSRARARRFDMEFVYPGIEDREGRMLRRSMSLTRPELDEYRESLRGLIARLRHSEDSGDWPAVVSDEACSICPTSQECPIPRELRDHRGEIRSVEQAAEAAWSWTGSTRRPPRCARNQGVLQGAGHGAALGGKVWEFVPKSPERMNHEGLIAAARSTDSATVRAGALHHRHDGHGLQGARLDRRREIGGFRWLMSRQAGEAHGQLRRVRAARGRHWRRISGGHGPREDPAADRDRAAPWTSPWTATRAGDHAA